MGEVANQKDGECEQTGEEEQTDQEVSVAQISEAERRCGIFLNTDSDAEEAS
ncbi:hypothetical protein [Haloarcula sp. JP-L23]|uniref:hypothetical protein n=1 Tax=Haloarcula sp. JP-L23 TaxID=2716717 RepID=UPI00140ED069|nr:hypothetical protein G9465_18115 [Haloarcula sp. JP-L23]